MWDISQAFNMLYGRNVGTGVRTQTAHSGLCHRTDAGCSGKKKRKEKKKEKKRKQKIELSCIFLYKMI
jgi:hypothetical protein